jgi:hypothetical protein
MSKQAIMKIVGDKVNPQIRREVSQALDKFYMAKDADNQKPMLSSSGNQYEVLGRKGQVVATFQKTTEGRKQAQEYLQMNYEDLVANDAQSQWSNLAAWKDACRQKYGDKIAFHKVDYMTYAYKSGKSSPVGYYDSNMGDADLS